MLRFWLIDVPAGIVTIWYRMYVVILAIASIISVGCVTAMLLLAAFGIRWGW